MIGPCPWFDVAMVFSRVYRKAKVPEHPKAWQLRSTHNLRRSLLLIQECVRGHLQDDHPRREQQRQTLNDPRNQNFQHRRTQDRYRNLYFSKTFRSLPDHADLDGTEPG